jgi:hypothetical protein
MTKENEMAANQDKETQERLETEERNLAGLLAQLPDVARALARTYETRRPMPGKRGRQHAV